MVKLLPTVAEQCQQSGKSWEIWNDKEIKPNQKTISQVLLSQNNYYSKTRLHGPSRALPPQLNTNISMSMRPTCFEVGVPQHRKNDPLFLTTYLYRVTIFYHSSTRTLLIQKYFPSTGFRRKFAAEFFGRKFEFGAKPFRRKKSTEAISRETSTGKTLLRIRTEYGP